MNKQILFTRKNEAISSYISEKMFFNNFLSISEKNITNGWWISKTLNNSFLLFITKAILSELDIEILDSVRHNFENVFQLFLVEKEIKVINIDSKKFTV